MREQLPWKLFASMTAIIGPIDFFQWQATAG